MRSSIIYSHFKAISEKQESQFEKMFFLYTDWNQKINLISRKDIESLYLKHVLHSLSIAKFIRFNPNAKILDVGTGGGFPGIPLAILFPETHFHLVDSIEKKIKAVNDISKKLGLQNVEISVSRAENLAHLEYDFIISRAVSSSLNLYRWTKYLIKKKNEHKINNGYLLLKGGDLSNEVDKLQKYTQKIRTIPLDKLLYNESHFKKKKLLYFYT